MSTPMSTIKICSGVCLDPRYEHSIYFASATAQQTYFAGKVVKTFSAYSYLRKTWPLQVEATMAEANTWSYLYFQNNSGRYYYYFITNVEYKNDNTVELTLELDVLQTYLYDSTSNVKLLPSFIERTHTTTDVIGEHTLDEGLELGEHIDAGCYDWTDLNELCIMVITSFNPNVTITDKPAPALGYLYDNVFSGLKVWAVDIDRWADWSNQLDDLSEKGFIDGIVAMWMYPKALVSFYAMEDSDLARVIKGCGGVSTFSSITMPTELDGYEPRNKKLLCYPYNYLYATNNNGSSAVYRYERFQGDDLTFFAQGSASPDGMVKMYPAGYNGITFDEDKKPIENANYEQGLTLSGFPCCAWDADVYKLWLAQNQNQHKLAGATAVISAGVGAVTAVAGLASGNLMLAGGGATAAVSGVNQIATLLAQKADMQTQPPQARGSYSANVNTTVKKQTFSFYRKTISAENARIIDDYFTMYGYKVNRVLTPNLHARPSFTYIKTVGCNISGKLCNTDLNKIQSIFDKGITFWMNGDKIADYSQNNAV